mgnify:CR=1 FL=1
MGSKKNFAFALILVFFRGWPGRIELEASGNPATVRGMRARLQVLASRSTDPLILSGE